MRTHKGPHCPAGHSFYTKPTLHIDPTSAANEEQLARILSVNCFTVKVERCKPFSKQVTLSGRDAARAMKTLARNGWTEL